MFEKFISELLSGTIFCTPESINRYLPAINAYLRGEIIEYKALEPLKLAAYDSLGNFTPNFSDNNTSEKAVGIIEISGLITRNSGWWSYGADDYAELLNEAYENTSIKAIVLKINCHGSTPDAMVTIGEALKKRNKPVLAAVDLNALSGGYYTAIHTDKICPVHQMAEFGSIGVMARMVDDTDAYKQMGYKVITVNSSLSPWKNKPTEEAKKGNVKLLQSEELDPWAQFFIDKVKELRPKLDQTTEGILQGRTFFGTAAVENGLADIIMPFDEVVQYAFNYEMNEKVNSSFK